MEYQPLAVKTQNLNHGASREFPQIQGLNCNQYPEKQLDAGHSIVHQNIGHRGDQAGPGAVRLCLQVAPGYPLAALSMNRPMAATLPSQQTGAAPGQHKSRPFRHQVWAGALPEDQHPRALNPDAGD